MPRPRRPPAPAVTPSAELGNEIRHWRELRGLSVAELAAAVGRDRRTISGAEDGRDRPSEALVNMIEARLASGGLILSYYDAVLAEVRRQRLNGRVLGGIAPDASDDDLSVFVDETVADGTVMAPGHRFEKTWTIRNEGAVEWRDRRLTRLGTPAGPGLITTPRFVPLPFTAPGAELTIAVSCVAPLVEGTTRAVFKMTDGEDRRYFYQPRYTVGLQVQVTVARDV
nr:NBR1-Ig-like domain-containing protein [Cellulomonas sp.]